MYQQVWPFECHLNPRRTFYNTDLPHPMRIIRPGEAENFEFDDKTRWDKYTQP